MIDKNRLKWYDSHIQFLECEQECSHWKTFLYISTIFLNKYVSKEYQSKKHE